MDAVEPAGGRPLSDLDPATIQRIDVVKGVEGRLVRVTTKKAANGGGEV